MALCASLIRSAVMLEEIVFVSFPFFSFGLGEEEKKGQGELSDPATLCVLGLSDFKSVELFLLLLSPSSLRPWVQACARAWSLPTVDAIATRNSGRRASLAWS